MGVQIHKALASAADLASRYQVSVFQNVRREPEASMRRGGCATVYPGTAPDGTKVAIKTYRCGPPERDEDIRSILRELYLWSKLHHKSILPLLGITFKFEHTVSLVSPWMAKGNAHDYVQDKSIDPRPLLVDIADGLLYLHTHNPPIYHGDLKGYNVLISDEGRAVLTDFGLSFLVNSSISMARSPPNGGTLNWLAPESVDDFCCITAERDVWAFGMTTLELFTGRNPFPDIHHSLALIIRILRGPNPQRPTDEAAHSRMTNGWWKICCACWERDPPQRPTISDIVDEIKALKPPVACILDCVGLHQLIPLFDRKLVPTAIPDHILSGLVVFIRTMENSIETVRQGVPVAKSILESESSTELKAFEKVYQHRFMSTLCGLKSAKQSFKVTLTQCKNANWELVQAKGATRAWRHNGRIKGKLDAKEHLLRVISALEVTIGSIDDLIHWWTTILGIIAVLKTPRNQAGICDSAKGALQDIIRYIELYEAWIQEPMEKLRAQRWNAL